MREVFVEGGGTPALLAIHQDSTGKAKQFALSYAKALGATRAGVLETTFTEETETDLFGEQAVLCGGVSELIKAGFQTLVDAGYQPEIAYFECCHELKLIVDLIYRGGLNYMRYSVSDTAEWGDYTAGPQVINAETRKTMKGLLSKNSDRGIRREVDRLKTRPGCRLSKKTRRKEQHQLLEQVGAKLRARMQFLNPVEVATEPETAATGKR